MEQQNEAFTPQLPKDQTPTETRKLLTPPKGKSPMLAFAMLLILAAAQLATTIQNFNVQIDNIAGSAYNTLYMILLVVSLLAEFLIYLKFLLPGWEPHRNHLRWIFIVWLVVSVVVTIYVAMLGVNVGMESMLAQYGQTGAGFSTMMTIFVIITSLISVALNANFVLFLGVMTKKSTEKVAALLSIIMLGFVLIGIPLRLISNAMVPEASAVNSISNWITTGIGIVMYTCTFVLLRSWPVLSKTVFEKKQAE